MEESIEEKENKKWKKKFIFSWIITIPIIIVMYSEMIFGISILPMEFITPFSLFLGFFIIFVIGFDTIKLGIKGFYTFYFNMDSLIALGTVIAYLTGFLSYFGFTNYSGISSMIMTIFITGKYIESKAKGRASSEIRKLLELGAKKAIVIRNNKEVEIPIEELKVNDIMIIKPGEKIPTDGVVTKGESFVDESMVTGESIPVDKKIKSNVIGATINQDGILYVKATKIGRNTFLSHIIELIEEAQGTKVPIQKTADKITNIFVPSILIISSLTLLFWYLKSGSLSIATGVAISILVIACPCALGIATPITLMVGSGIGAKKGILIRKGEAIQTMKDVKIIVFDKTGTITKGKPDVTNIYCVNEKKEKEMIKKVASIERLSEHPVAKAIVNYANLNEYKKVSNFKVIRGMGVEGIINNKKILIGNNRLIIKNKIPINSVKEILNRFEKNGKTTMIICEEKNILGIIGVADVIKEDSINAIKRLKKQGYKTVMITGDNYNTASAIAKEVGIEKIIAQVLPKDKVKRIERLQKEGMVAFIGDGINDAPALKQANVGIAMGSGTDIAIESGDIVLVNDSLNGVVDSINLSNATFIKIKQNLFWAFLYNTIAIPLAVFGVLNPVIAEIAMALSSISVITNANLLRRKII